MSSRKTSETSDSISLFPFLAVLLCTMGALLVLLVILVQRAAELSLLPDGSLQLVKTTQPELTPPGPEEAARNAELHQDLDEVAVYQKQVDELRAEARQRLEAEKQRLSHAEEHTRRMEEELAKLAIAAEQLKQTEANQTVDQQQAERELARLEQLTIDTEKQLEALRENATGGKKSYAIVPYKGPNGTYRKPIYLECTAKGVTIHPEGLQLTETDFIAPSWPGNPLASILRASREYLNDKAAKENAPEPPDPYPLILVRPDGIEAYALARAAITSWDSDYGYEFVDKDMKLAFPEAADPELARVQHHAMLIARERLIQLVQAAPSRFRGVRVGSGPSGDGSGTGYGGTGRGSNGIGGVYGSNGEARGSAGTAVGIVGNGGPGDEQQGEQGLEGNGAEGAHQYGNLSGGSGGPAGGEAGAEGFADGTEAGSEASTGGEPNLVGPRYAQQGSGMAANAPSEPLNGQNQPGGSASGQQTASSAGGSTGSEAGAAGGSPGMSFSNNQPGPSIADSKGANWALEKSHLKSVAIRRPIPVVVRDNKMILLANKNIRRGVESTGQEISLEQPIHAISEDFEAAVKERLADWGLAGSGMYWKPVLQLNVESNAQMTATRIVHLLKDSGVEVESPATATAANPNQGGTIR
jgi:hypothetical protein